MAQTPARNLPGAFFQTPAPPNGPLFRRGQTPPRPRSSSSSRQPAPQLQAPDIAPIIRAANTINDTLLKEASFPDLDSYVTQGMSVEYDISENEAWAPYQKKNFYEIPPSILQAYNTTQSVVSMGLFAELNHAWMVVDSALFLWDYTNPNPEIIGYEEETAAISAVKLIIPRKDVFTETITHVLVVATAQKITLLAVSAARNAAGTMAVALYRTDLSLSIKGISVEQIVGSAATGRIFFSAGSNDIHELTYQTEDKWFSNRCSKINHTSTAMGQITPSGFWAPKSTERIVDLVVDDTRYLVYALSSTGTIRTFHMNTPQTLNLVITKSKKSLLDETSHMLSTPSPLFDQKTSIISISPISANEASKLHIMATTSSGCRLFLSATRGYGYIGSQNAAPQSMQLQHLKFPPKELQQNQQQPPGQTVQYPNIGPTALDIQSRSLQVSDRAIRYPPGFFLDFVTKDNSPAFFLSAPDSGRLAYRPSGMPPQMLKYYEQAIWMDIDGTVQDVGLMTKPFAASAEPKGFGNELAVQFDEPAPEFAVMTNTGIQLVRRRRLLDIFSSAIKQNGSYEDPEDGIHQFIKRYGYGEAAAAALAVACGQTVDNGDVRVVKMADPATMELARKAFVENGLKAIAQGGTDIDQVRPSSRHEGIALYASRVVRSLWKSKVIDQRVDKAGHVTVSSEISIKKLKIVQEDLTKLSEFLEKNKNFIHGLEGPTELQRVSNPEDETALKGEHRALHSLRLLIKDMIEGISFVQMLFDERVDQIWLSLDDPTRQQLRDLTYERLFSNDSGKTLAKVLVKAIVTRNITNGSNIETVADALRRRCGSFCSTEDVITFKAQEQIKKAAEKGRDTDLGRSLLNDSLTLLSSIAEHLPFATLESTVVAYTPLQFFAGAIELALNVASAHDKGNKASHWIIDGSPPNDSRSDLYNFRTNCYALIIDVLETLDTVTSTQPTAASGHIGTIDLKRQEAYSVVFEAEDEMFHNYLYDYYRQNGWMDRLLDVDTKYITPYLEKLALQSVDYADYLWRFYSKSERYYEAGVFQLSLANNLDFQISLDRRIEYLSFAKANAMTVTAGVGRQSRQLLLHEVNNLLDVANIQADLLQRLLSDARISDQAKRMEIKDELDGPVKDLTTLFNRYAEIAGYWDLALLMYQAADYRVPDMIRNTWSSLIESIHTETIDKGANSNVRPYEAIINCVRDLSHKLTSDTFFSPRELIPLIERYSIENPDNAVSRNWVPDLFIDISIPYETIMPILESMFYAAEVPFSGNNRMVLARHLVYVAGKWFEACVRENKSVFSSREGAHSVVGLLEGLERHGLAQEEVDNIREVKRKVARYWGP